MSDTLPMFPLGTVLFPGVSVPLTVFEDRYRALVHHLLRIEDPIQRVFGTVGIRDGYELGDHGAQSLYRTGVKVLLTEVEPHSDGTFSVRGRRVSSGSRSASSTPRASSPSATSSPAPSRRATSTRRCVDRARSTFTAYRAALAELRADPYSGELPRDPSYLSWTLAACAPLPMPAAPGAARGRRRLRAAAAGHRPAAGASCGR